MRAALRFALRQVRARPLASFSVAFLLGLVLRRDWPVPTLACAAAMVAAVIAATALRGHKRAFAALLLLTGLVTGMTRMGLAQDAIVPIETQYSAEMVGRVISEPFTNPDTGRRICKFEVETVRGEPSGIRLRLYLRGDAEPLEQIAYGQRLKLTGHIWAADPVTNPYEFDFGAYLNRQGLDAYATAKIEDTAILGTSHDVYSLVIDARRAISRRIDALFPNNAGMMRALVLGDRSLLGEELRQSLNRSGTAHLISISGLHVTVMSLLLAFVLGRFMSRRTANLITVLLLIPYGALIGFTAPFVRALAMFAILSYAPVAGLPSDSITRLCAVLLAWLLVKPLSVDDAGFVLSFSASAGILLLMPPLTELTGVAPLRRRKPSPDPLKRLAKDAALYLPTLLCASLAAQLATLPVVIAFFGVQSVLSVPFNLVCVPLCMLGYILGLIALFISILSVPLAQLFTRVPDGLFTWLIGITRYGGSIPAAGVRIGRYPAPLVAVHWILVMAASDLSKIKLSWRRFMPFTLAGVAALSSLVAFLLAWNFSVVFLDADQADCAVVRSRGHTFLIDAGDTYTPAADYLNATCLHLDGVVLSHPHQDHAGGLSEVLESFKPDAIYVPVGWFEAEDVAPAVLEGIQMARDMGVEIVELSTGDIVQISKTARLEVYGPDGIELPDATNDMSLLALVTCEGQRALFTGDLSTQNEPEVIPDADILKVAHHGSNKATSDRFLAAVTPDIAVISVGENNYGHPSDETIQNLVDAGATIYQTRQCGAITLTWRGGAWRVDTYQEAWHELE